MRVLFLPWIYTELSVKAGGQREGDRLNRRGKGRGHHEIPKPLHRVLAWFSDLFAPVGSQFRCICRRVLCGALRLYSASFVKMFIWASQKLLTLCFPGIDTCIYIHF